MRILLLAQFFPPDIGGEERHVYNLAETLAGRGHVVSVATQRITGTPDEQVLPSGVHVYRFGTVPMRLPWVYSTNRPHHPPFPDPLAVRELGRVLDTVKPDVVHAHNWAINSILPLRRRTASRSPFGLVLTLHDYSHVCACKRLMRNGSTCEGPSPARCLSCASSHYGSAVGPVTVAGTYAMRVWGDHSIDHVVSVSSAVAGGNHISGRAGTSVIPNFIPDALLDPATGGSPRPAAVDLPDGPFLLFVGDLSAEKGVPALLRAYELLDAPRPPLVLVGRRTPDTPEALPPGVSLHFEWSHEHVLEAFRRCTVAVLPSVWPDPCPTTVLEAMASGSPVVATSIGGIVDMVSDEVSGLLVAPGNVTELRDAIGRLVGDEALRARLAGHARAAVREFTASRVAERLEAIYRKVAA